MKKFSWKSGAISGLVLMASSVFSPAQAQMFQNNNVSCENRAVCTAGSGGCLSDSQSITCRNQSGGALFNSDTFVDCAAGEGEGGSASDTTVSVLLNNGSGATCGSGAGQFASAANYIEDNNFSIPSDAATILAGPISAGARASVLLPYIDTASSFLAFDTPNASGVFPETPSHAAIFTGILDRGYSSSTVNRTSAMFDCNADNFLDVVVSGGSQPLSLFTHSQILEVLTNDQAGSFNASQVGVLVDTGNTGTASSIAVGDFNDDGISDVAVATDAKSGSVNQQILTCLGDGACGFTCGSVVDVVSVNSSTLVEIGLPTIAAGDFNGDGLDDVAVGLRNNAAGFNGVEYFYNNSSSPNTFAAPVAVSVTDETGNSFPENITTGFFNNDAIVDVAVTLTGVRGNGTAVYVITSSNASGGLNAPLTLNFTADPTTDTDIVDNAWSLDASDFDQQGCDDIIALATDANGGRNAYVFMNSVETLDVDAGTAYVTGTGSGLELTGTCTLNPADSTTTASSITPIWTVVSGPGAASFTNADTLTPTFNATTNGTYTVQLSCQSQCVPATTATATIVVDLNLEGSGLHSCSFNPLASYSPSGIAVMLSGVALLLGFRRKK